MKRKVFHTIIILFGFITVLYGQPKDQDLLFARFQNPPVEARPFVRWWWNGDRLNKNEIIREIHLLKDAGFGGVEINPIAGGEKGIPGYKSLVWLSPEWNDMLKVACSEAEKLNMVTDLIIGTGWPFGGQFLKPNQYLQRIVVNQIKLSGPGTLHKNINKLLEIDRENRIRKSGSGKYLTEKIAFIKLLPENLKDLEEIISLDSMIDPHGEIKIPLGKGNYYLVWGVKQNGYREVVLGAPGGDGPVMDHYDREVTMAFLSRLKKIAKDLGIPLNRLVRALFCDSIELDGANWSDGFSEKFREKYGYDIEEWFPFIFYNSQGKYLNMIRNSTLLEKKIVRVRYDFNRFLVDEFLENFTKVVKSFCEDNDLLFRYQAYGSPWHMGISEGYLIPDIPEGNNWLFSNKRAPYADEYFTWNDEHGYLIWNKYAAAGGHLKKEKIISCEAMTNVGGYFDVSLEDIKQADDINFITGITHSVVHGFNFSPPQAGIPGWVRFGTYFSEHNPWWKYIKKWTIYNARLSVVFQNSTPVTEIGIIGPTGELWGEKGLNRLEMHTTPFYCYHLWESFSNIGSTCDYLSEAVLDTAFTIKGSESISFPYKMLVFTDVHAITPRTIQVLNEFLDRGGKIAFVGTFPSRYLSLKDLQNTSIKSAINHIRIAYPEQVFFVERPESLDHLIPWSINLFKTAGIHPRIHIENPLRYVYQIQSTQNNRNIYFFVNSDRKKEVSLKVRFPENNYIPWVWDPETGTRKICSYVKGSNNEMEIPLKPLQSRLIVFDPNKVTDKVTAIKQEKEESFPGKKEIKSKWLVDLYPVEGNRFSYHMDQLTDFRNIPLLEDFAGEAVYITTIKVKNHYSKLDLGEVNRGITEVILNGVNLGICWYGRHEYNVSKALKQGKNKLEIRYTPVMKNYCLSLKDNQNIKGENRSAVGIQGPVLLIK